jgi:hypothetical protein
MQEDEQMALAAQMAAIMARFETRCDRIEQQLHALAQQVPAQMEEQTARWLQTASGQVEGVARAGLETPLAEGRQRVQGIAAEADQTVRTLQGIRRDFSSMARWVWIGVGASLAFSLVALVGTYEMLYGHYATRYDELKSQVNYLDAINHSDVVPCGEGRLCARIDDKAPKVGDKKQYRLIEPRP